MINYNTANEIVFEEISKIKLSTEEVPLLGSLNRLLAEDVLADVNLPPFDNSAMDGYAIKYNPKVKEWDSIGEISAGNYKNYLLTDDTAVYIMTGSKLPLNCTAIVPIEDVDIINQRIKLKSGIQISEGQNIRKCGEDIRQGEKALGKFTLVQPNHISILAACGKSKVKVFRKLKIGVMATGDELIDIDEIPSDDKIRATNLYSLIASINDMNIIPINFGFEKDDRKKVHAKIKSILKSDVDILVTSGGVSVGKYDYLKEIFSELNVEIKFWRVNIKPGKPLVFGVFTGNEERKFIFGLPGNPVSSFVTFNLFVRVSVENLYHIKKDRVVSAELLSDIKKIDGKRHFVRGKLNYSAEDKKYLTEIVGSQSSGNMVGLGLSNCLIVIEEDKLNPKKGDIVQCIKI